MRRATDRKEKKNETNCEKMQKQKKKKKKRVIVTNRFVSFYFSSSQLLSASSITSRCLSKQTFCFSNTVFSGINNAAAATADEGNDRARGENSLE